MASWLPQYRWRKGIERSAHSQVISEMLDYSTVVFVPTVGIVAQSAQLPHPPQLSVPSCALSCATSPSRRSLRGTCSPPAGLYPVASTRPNLLLGRVPPWRLRGHHCTLGHHLDVGGRAREARRRCHRDFRRAFRIPPTRIVAAGVPRVRLPTPVRSDTPRRRLRRRSRGLAARPALGSARPTSSGKRGAMERSSSSFRDNSSPCS